MKKIVRLFIGVMIAGGFLTGCKKNKTPSDVFQLDYKKGDSGYYITVERYEHTISTINGSIGVRFEKNNYRADEPIYSHYQSVEKVEDGLLAKGEITSPYGTVIAFTDFISTLADRVLVNRKVLVKIVGDDEGFMIEQKWTDLDDAPVHQKEWFIPGMIYVNGNHSFDKVSTRVFFDGESVTIPADDVSALVTSSLYKGYSLAMLDTTPGYRETSIVDRYTVDESYLNIDENFNFPGIVLSSGEDNKTSMSHIYPSLTRRAENKIDYRLLPVKQNFKRQVSFELFMDKYDSYNDMYQSVWSKAFSHFGYVDKRYQLKEVFDVLREHVKKSYSANNMWGNIPQYFTNADHYFPDSGFLYRNLEMATEMIKYGREIEDQATIDNAITVINYQIDNDCIDTKMKAYARDNSVFKRILFDGLASTVELYEYLLSIDYPDVVLTKKLYKYITEKATLYKNDESLLAISFYSRLYKLQDKVFFLDYKDVALRIADEIAERTKEYDGYYGAIENSDKHISVAEDYMLMLRGMMNVYEASRNHRYLKEADRLAKYLSTFSLIQPINMNPIGSTGAEGYFSGFIGNERFLGYGYSFNNTNHCILDCPTVGSIIEYHKLAKYTGDSFYNDLLAAKIYNALLYVNMGDKVGQMDDPQHSSGEGYINEFAGNSLVKESYPEAGIRGALHDSLLGWNIYEILYALNYLLSVDYEGFNDGYKLTHDLARNKVISIDNDNVAHSVYGMNDELAGTYYINGANSEFVMDLNEHCFVESVEITSDSSVKVYASNDNNEFIELTNLSSVNQKMRYVKFSVDANNKVSSIKINGYPVKYDTLSAGATIVDQSGSMANAIDKSNYTTSWNAGVNGTLVLDLNSVAEIYQTAIMFSATSKYSYKIETSIDGSNYVEYAKDDGVETKYVFVNERFVKARYVKLTILGSVESNILVKDFKVMGSK